jgi:hypothetical protein
MKKCNIKDFGAVGDGRTDDTKAFQKAADYLGESGGEIYLGDGEYVVDGWNMPGHTTLIGNNSNHLWTTDAEGVV